MISRTPCFIMISRTRCFKHLAHQEIPFTVANKYLNANNMEWFYFGLVTLDFQK
uniref:Uncharacterized protein n=1 Tax=Arundo donax TaxID=35708 RepID=A0A0A9GW12_ARUDO